MWATQCQRLGQSFGDSSHDQFIVTLEIVGYCVYMCLLHYIIEPWFSHLYSDGAQEIGMCSFFDWWFQMCLHIPSCWWWIPLTLMFLQTADVSKQNFLGQMRRFTKRAGPEFIIVVSRCVIFIHGYLVLSIYAHACIHGTGPSTWLCKFSWWYLPNTNWTHHRLVFKYTMSIGLTHRGPPVLAYASQQVVYNPFVPMCHKRYSVYITIYNRDIPPVDANGIFYAHRHIYTVYISIYTYSKWVIILIFSYSPLKEEKKNYWTGMPSRPLSGR